MTDQPITEQQLAEFTESHPGDWYAGEWRTEYNESTDDQPSHYVVKHQASGQVLAELPDWAGPIALFVADAHDAVPALLAEIRRLKSQRKYLITQLAKRDAETGRGDEALREFLAGEPAAAPAAGGAGE